ncbi:sulfite exporter TauE/SafE family protein [Mumia sp. zg.B53]|uniref:sulfite exporter TauE/SafE family protein n=1 Tax=Mumia sp. zg.B53 TaxID=2855449 RepID=UPI001C6E4BA9|nr:sulfite exporter TauE/SafE family protein [Mumia sp. zg.B53]MBW9215946.1 sulfite exporter TauE/SafE family protein [Mumia sp. zg.B53]
MSLALVAVAVCAGTVIGLSLGALGGGGSILAVPVLVYLLDQSTTQAMTGSLVVVTVTSLIAAVAAHRAGNVLLGRGIVFGAVGTGGAAAGATLSSSVSQDVLLAAFAALLLLVGGLMAWRLVRSWRGRTTSPRHRSGLGIDDPIISTSPTFVCRCPQALMVLTTATLVGFVTGLLGVGGGFLVVPALVLALGLPIDLAAGTSLVAITVTSVAALMVRTGSGSAPDWVPVLLLTAVSVIAAVLGVRLAAVAGTARLQGAFAVLVLAVAAYTAARALPALV